MLYLQMAVESLSAQGLLLIFAKAAILIALTAVMSDLFLHSAASVKHTLWLCCLLGMAALPLAAGFLPAWSIPLVEAPFTGRTDASAVQSSWHVAEWLIFIYLTVVLLRGVSLLLSLGYIAWVTGKAVPAAAPITDDDLPRLQTRVSPDIDSPVTWGTLKAFVLLPRRALSWSAAELAMVMQHEGAHIRRRDWLAQLLGQWVAILYWPVPGVRHALQNLSFEAERACDDYVLAHGVRPSDYAGLLLRQARMTTLKASVALGRPAELSLRIRHIVDAYIERVGERRSRVLVALFLGLVCLPLATMQVRFIQPLTQSFSASGINSRMNILDGVPAVATKATSASSSLPLLPPIARPVRPAHPGLPQHPDSVAIATESALQSIPNAAVARPLVVVDFVPVESAVLSEVTLLRQQSPKYPAGAIRRGIEGRVVVEFDVNADGLVINPHIKFASPAGVFDRASLQALDGYRYTPASVNGKPAAQRALKETFTFKLLTTRRGALIDFNSS